MRLVTSVVTAPSAPLVPLATPATPATPAPAPVNAPVHSHCTTASDGRRSRSRTRRRKQAFERSKNSRIEHTLKG